MTLLNKFLEISWRAPSIAREKDLTRSPYGFLSSVRREWLTSRPTTASRYLLML